MHKAADVAGAAVADVAGAEVVVVAGAEVVVVAAGVSCQMTKAWCQAPAA
mgnify:CR=1 FL=1